MPLTVIFTDPVMVLDTWAGTLQLGLPKGTIGYSFEYGNPWAIISGNTVLLWENLHESEVPAEHKATVLLLT